MISLSNLKAPAGSRRERKRVGRGQGSGWGKTAGRGTKGQKSRTGNMGVEGFEGGQMPLQRRLPKFGFVNPFRRELAGVNLESLEAFFSSGEVVDEAALREKGLVKGRVDGVKLLARGELTRALTVRVDSVSAAARAAVEKAGGTVELVPRKQVVLPARGQGARARLSRERSARRAAAKAEKP